jgi:hypothetical protein
VLIAFPNAQKLAHYPQAAHDREGWPQISVRDVVAVANCHGGQKNKTAVGNVDTLTLRNSMRSVERPSKPHAVMIFGSVAKICLYFPKWLTDEIQLAIFCCKICQGSSVELVFLIGKRHLDTLGNDS